MSTRTTREDWLNIGLQAIAEEGPDGLTIEALCRRSKKTRGSFYHHFESIQDYLHHLLAWWEQRFTLDIIERIERGEQPGNKLKHLNLLAAHLDSDVEQGFRRLASKNTAVAEKCITVDSTRIRYLAELYQQSSSYGVDEALILAKLEYAAWVGFQLVFPGDDVAAMMKLFDKFVLKNRVG